MNTDEEKKENALVVPNAPITVRLGTRDDIPFIDALQKRHNKALGFFPRAQLEGYLDNGWVLIAEEGQGVRGQGSGNTKHISPSLAPDPRPLTPRPVGYVASRDRYLKRDELGVVYQLCVSPAAQRGLIGASLIKAMFERSAYGCRLYCCWCAQDLAANRFWEALGFVPIAFRGGSEKKSRTHIFWQKRVRANDASTPWWFPSKTEGGALREDRIVLPIPPGLHWSDPMPVLKAAVTGDAGATGRGVPRPVSSSLPEAHRARSTATRGTRRKLVPGMEASPLPATKTAKARIQFGPPGAVQSVEETKPAQVIAPVARIEAPPCAFQVAKPVRAKVDPALITAARDLRDRYLEQVNASPVVASVCKYNVTREDDAQASIEFVDPVPAVRQLAA